MRKKGKKIFFFFINLFVLILCPSRKDIQSGIVLSRMDDIHLYL